MELGLGLTERVVGDGTGEPDSPSLLVTLEPWGTTFLGNMLDFFRRQPPPLRLASKPGDFWPDVFVTSWLPWGKFAQSLFYHCIALTLLWAATLIRPHRVLSVVPPVFHSSDVIYYQASEYLPPLDTGGAKARDAKKGDPELAPQPIISVVPEADNRSQTIVTPPDIRLSREVAMPNVVAWSPRPVAVPIAATERTVADAKAPTFHVPVVAPAPDLDVARSRREIQAPQPAVVAPAPVVNAADTRRIGDLSIGPANAVAPAPQLALAPQRTVASARAALGSSGSAVVPPPPSLRGGQAATSGGRLIALGIHPVAPSGPVTDPGGNRRGTFAASPSGRAGAAGTPDGAGGPGASSGSGSGAAGVGSGANARAGVPSGLFVGAGPDPASRSAVAGNGQGQGTGGSAPAVNPVLLAKATPPRTSAISPHTPSELPSSRASEVDRSVFGDRKFYAMTLNMPNLNSAGGSWVIHFAELDQSDDKGSLVGPSPIAMADPAYPLELMKQNVQGTVTLYAIIRSDGSVRNVRVLRSVDDRLDQYASDALARWEFRPATKNGTPIDLEAVVTIPFRIGKLRSSF